MNILVTGGAGYIGSHTTLELLEAGHSVVSVDNYSNSSPESLRRVEKITGQSIKTYEADVCDRSKLDQIFTENQIDAVIHFAGLKAVGESVEQPLKYYRNNIDSSLSLLESMQTNGIKKLVFSSSATVYGNPSQLPLTEASQTGIGITNPYGQTKFIIEQILCDAAQANPDLEIAILRYFNPVGAHPSGQIGEDPNDIPNNLLPFVSQVAVGKLPEVKVFGNDYHTPDGTGVRDYIHVVDLAKGHLAALEHSHPGVDTFNLGTGNGTSVIAIIETFKIVSGKDVPYQIVDRRPGDIAACFADARKAQQKLNWQAQLTIADACRDAWNWQSQNPNGY